jgi:hypothetical protein
VRSRPWNAHSFQLPAERRFVPSAPQSSPSRPLAPAITDAKATSAVQWAPAEVGRFADLGARSSWQQRPHHRSFHRCRNRLRESYTDRLVPDRLRCPENLAKIHTIYRCAFSARFPDEKTRTNLALNRLTRPDRLPHVPSNGI